MTKQAASKNASVWQKQSGGWVRIAKDLTEEQAKGRVSRSYNFPTVALNTEVNKDGTEIISFNEPARDDIDRARDRAKEESDA